MSALCPEWRVYKHEHGKAGYGHLKRTPVQSERLAVARLTCSSSSSSGATSSVLAIAVACSLALASAPHILALERLRRELCHCVNLSD